jgi:hypothetical protein
MRRFLVSPLNGWVCAIVSSDPAVSCDAAPHSCYSTNPARRDYNIDVNAPVSQKPVADPEHDVKHQHRHSIYAAEATGLLLMAVPLLVLSIIRYWRYIPWSAR